MATHAAYPVTVEGQLDPQLSRWLWMVKWLLALPHYLILAMLWVAFAVMSVGAFFSILFTGRYPRKIFEFNVGVMRWSWRVGYYAYSALGTDKYPPFSLAEVPDYPAHLSIAYPEHLSRGLVLVKWLLAIPHYLIVAVLAGGSFFLWEDMRATSPGLIGVFVLISAVALAFSGKYPKGLYDLILGFNRWVIRVAAYTSLMTDQYPPFRLDSGGSETGGTLTVPPSSPGGTEAAVGATSRPSGWTGGRITAVVIGALFAITSMGLLAGGGLALWADQTQREGGFVTTPTQDLATTTHAIVAEDIDLNMDGPDWVYPSSIIGDMRIRATAAQTGDELFIGIAPANRVEAFLKGVSYASVHNVVDEELTVRSGGAAEVPETQTFWEASTQGPGTQSLTWEPQNGRWSVVMMNADASPVVAFDADAGAQLPHLDWFALALLVAGGVLLLGGVALTVAATHRASKASSTATS